MRRVRWVVRRRYGVVGDASSLLETILVVLTAVAMLRALIADLAHRL